MSSVIVWNNRSTGHHPAYMRAIAQVATSLYEQVWLPSWSQDYLPSRLRQCASFLTDEVSANITRANATVRALRPELTVIADATSHLPHLALHGWPSPLAIIDIRAQQCDLRYSRGFRRIWGILHLAMREVIVRRQATSFHVLDHRACAVGSSWLRRSTCPLPELRQTAPAEIRIAAGRTPTPDQRTAVLLGSLDARKGLDVLVETAALLSTGKEDLGIRFLVAGRPVGPYEEEVVRIMGRVQQDALPIDFKLDHLSELEYFQTLYKADYVLLPYVGHRGGSGLLASLDGYTGVVIASDGGWLGAVAQRIGIPTFREGDAFALARTIRDLERSRTSLPEPLGLPAPLYADSPTFGQSIFQASTA